MFLAGNEDGRDSGYPIKAFGYDKSWYMQIPNRTMLAFTHSFPVFTRTSFMLFISFIIKNNTCSLYPTPFPGGGLCMCTVVNENICQPGRLTYLHYCKNPIPPNLPTSFSLRPAVNYYP